MTSPSPASSRSDREFDLIAGSGGSISLCPSVEMLMALGTYPATGPALARRIPRPGRRHHDRRRHRPVHRDAPGPGGRALPGQRRRGAPG